MAIKCNLSSLTSTGSSLSSRMMIIPLLVTISVAMLEATTTLSTANLTSTAVTATTAPTAFSTLSTTVATTLSPETNALIEEVSQMVNCSKTICSPENSAPPTFYTSQRCLCDAQCDLLGECCPEAAPSRAFWRQPAAATVRGVGRPFWGCAKLPLRSNATSSVMVSMVTRCPRGHVLEKLCAREVAKELYDYKLDLPVLSGKTGAWFQNVFCAMCHGYASSLHKQYLSFRCSESNAAGAATDDDGDDDAAAPSGPEPGPSNSSVSERAAETASGQEPGPSNSSASERGAETAFDNSVDTDGSFETEHAAAAAKRRNATASSRHDGRNYFYVYKVLQEGKYQPGELEWKNPRGGSCKLAPEPAPFDEGGEGDVVPWERPCVALVDRCPDDWAGDPEVALLCASYAYHVVATATYKNPHCALCSNETRTLRCRKLASHRFQSKRRPPSLRLIMDYEWDAAAEGCAARGGVWDALHSRCQSLDEVCPAATRYKDGRCIADGTSGGNNGSSREEESRDASEYGSGDSSDGDREGEEGEEGEAPKDSCLRITLEVGEFELINGSLRLTLAGSPFFGMVLLPGDYNLLDDGRALVCNDYQHVLLPTDTVQGYMTVVCLTVSAVCLVLHMIIHLLLPKLHNLPGKNLQALSAALLLAQGGFLVGVSPPVALPRGLCEAVAALVHFFYLAAFCWMNVMSVDIWRTFSAAFAWGLAAAGAGGAARAHRRYALCAWGLPATVVALALLADNLPALRDDLRPQYAQAGICWFGSGLGLGIYLVVPVTLILVVNIGLFGATVFHLHRRNQGSRYLRKRRSEERNEGTTGAAAPTASPRPALPQTGPRDHVRFLLYVKLFVIMGATWLMGTLASLARWPALWYPFVLLNGLQGAFIFVMFDLKRNVLAMLWERLLSPRPPPAALRSPHAATATTITTTTTAGDTSRSRTLTTSASAPAPPPPAQEIHRNTVENGSVNGNLKLLGKDVTNTTNGFQNTEVNDNANDSTSKNSNKG